MEKSGFLSSVSWKVLAVILIGIVATGLAVPDTYQTLHQLWTKNNETYSHGYVLLAFTIYVLVTDSRWQTFRPAFWPIPLALGAGAVWMASNAVQIMMFQTLVLPAVLWCLLASMVGFKSSLKTLVPVLSLYLALPVMDILVTPLQDLTTWVNTRMIHAVGITAFIDGYDIHMPYGVLRIAHGCAGLNYLLAGTCLGIYYAYLNLQKLSLQIKAVALIVLLSIVGNWIRVFLLIMIGYESKMESELVYDHGFFGWVIFAVLAVGFFFYAKRLEAQDSEFTATNQGVALPLNAKMISAMVLSLAAFLVLPFTWSHLNSQAGTADMQVNVPDAFSGLRKSSRSLDDAGAVYQGSDHHSIRTGRIAGYPVALVTASYRTQKQAKELIYYANRPAKGLGKVTTLSGAGYTVNTAQTRDGQRVFWLYRVGESLTTTDMQTKLAQLKQVFSTPVASAVILQVSCGRDCDDTQQLQQALKTQLAALGQVEVR